jgi:hypothetical protein
MSYEYQHIDEMITFSGVAWTAKVFDNHRNLICDVLNYGDGNGNVYKWHNQESKEAMVRNAMEDFPGSMEPIDEFIHELWASDKSGFSLPEAELEDADLF